MFINLKHLFVNMYYGDYVYLSNYIIITRNMSSSLIVHGIFVCNYFFIILFISKEFPDWTNIIPVPSLKVYFYTFLLVNTLRFFKQFLFFCNKYKNSIKTYVLAFVYKNRRIVLKIYFSITFVSIHWIKIEFQRFPALKAYL